MKEIGLTGKRRSTTIAATPDDGKTRGKEEEVYGFMLNVQKSNNLILNSIVHCDILFTSPLWKHRRLLFVYTRSSRKPHSNATLWCICIVYILVIIFMDVIYPQ